MTDIADLSVETTVGDLRRSPHRFITTVRNLGPDTARSPSLLLTVISGVYTVESMVVDMPSLVDPGIVLPQEFSGILQLALQWPGSGLATGRSIIAETLVTPAARPQNIRFVASINTDSTDPVSANNAHDQTWTFPIARRGTRPRYGVPVGWGSPSPALLE